MFRYRWKTRPDVSRLEQTVSQLRMTIIVLRQELASKQGYASKLELVLQQRHQTIDTLRSRIHQLQQCNRQLDEEADHLAEMVRQS
jgi:cell division septum initiation protein DivIVA